MLRPPIESAQYLSIRYTNRLAEAGISPSVGSVGDSYDNALAESVIGLYKTELIRQRGPWEDRDQVEYATLEYVDWFNHRRLLEPIGHIPPAPPVSWTLGLCGRVMVVVGLPFVRWLLSDRGVKPAGVIPGFDPPTD